MNRRGWKLAQASATRWLKQFPSLCRVSYTNGYARGYAQARKELRGKK